MTTYWFRSLSTGDKVTATSQAEIARLAKREANRFNTQIQVHSGAEGRKSHRHAPGRMVRNPIYGQLAPLTKAARRHKTATRKAGAVHNLPSGSYTDEAWQVMGTRNGKHLVTYANTKAQAENEARYLKGVGYKSVTVHRTNPRKRTPGRMVRNPSLGPRDGSWIIRDKKTGKHVAEIFKGDKRIKHLNTEKYEAIGAERALGEFNKKLKTNPVRKKGSGPAKYTVEWHYAGTGSKQRITYGNKGIATIKANALKRDGAKGVRVFQGSR